MAKTVKLADIAKVVGVSTVTVSKALSGQKGVSEEMRERIKELADEMGYVPLSSRASSDNKQYNIGVLIQEIYLDKYASFYWQLYQELNKRMISRGSFTLLEMIKREDVANNTLPVLAQEKRVDGIVVVGAMSEAYLVNLEQNAGVPVVYMDYYNGYRSVDTVIPNSFKGAYELTNYLFSCGHSDIAFVGTVRATQSITDRFMGYLKSLVEHQVTFVPEWLIPDRDIKTGRIDTESFMHLPENMPTAFVCNCDLTAAYLVKKLEKAGYRVPQDVSVTGFDNYLYPGTCDIGITTYEVNIEEMARRTTHKIVRKAANEHYTDGVFVVDGHLVCKDSVAKIS